ncbi:nitrite/sulfite reductase [Geopsychrobacter electrodiphilus]|uniref:nitrite/sulfite reductase n=1 Tax=Geopsychrobacter electrodiphilus TaxID=225196 RepID=UPI000381397A|nr:nitrite/sulfite reductase [Geopsychrobacter electrodiphilus]
MELDEQKLRLEGIYKQNEQGEYMQRVKLAGGILSTQQAGTLAKLGERFGSGILHLSTRGSIEFHGLKAGDLSKIYRGLASVGLFSRGACGGAVRGISCSSSFGPGFGRTQVLLRHFLTHFSGNPHFEGLPKKFKIAIEAGYAQSRHLIQDLALVLVEEQGDESRYDVWIAGGLGREPQAGFILAERVIEAELLPLAEAIIAIYKNWGEKGRRLKYMLNTLGEAELRRRITEHLEQHPVVRFSDAFPKQLLPAESSQRVALDIFVGELPAAKLNQLVTLASRHSCDWFLVTPDQNIEMLVDGNMAALQQSLTAAGFYQADEVGALRVCPGNQECRMGLCATRDLALRIRRDFGPKLQNRSLAISGCPNSCAQPQLADFGIIPSSLRREGETRVAQFNLYVRRGTGLGELQATGLSKIELLAQLEERLALS